MGNARGQYTYFDEAGIKVELAKPSVLSLEAVTKIKLAAGYSRRSRKRIRVPIFVF